MKILYVGPGMVIDKILAVSKKNFPNIEADFLRYDRYIEVPDLLEKYRGRVDAVLFTGKSPFKFFEKRQKDFVLSDYIPRHETTLYRVLLEITYLLKFDISRLSIDTYDKAMLKRLYKEIGVEFKDEHMFFAEQKYLEEDYIKFVLEFHKYNYQNNDICCCITGLEEAYHAMKKENIPVVLALPSEDVMVQSIKNIQMRYIAKKNNENQIVVLAIKLNMLSEYSLMKEDEYAYLSQRIKILDKLYHFNSRIDGVLVEQSRSEFMIFTTKKILELETKKYRDIYLLDMIREVSVINTYIGIGYGKTANEAKFNAYESIKMAQSQKNDAAYVVFENGEIMGPLKPNPAVKEKNSFDERFYQIATETGLSANTVYKVFNKIINSGKTEFTSKELAIICGVSIRTMDRIILRLCDSGYCEVVSEQLMSKYGRPSRILRFKPFLLF
ncbi:TPA: hypothetical protein KQV96_002815 [Clostridioides difficile]|nr:hypothetical protein [Clostridioides difficile]